MGNFDDFIQPAITIFIEKRADDGFDLGYKGPVSDKEKIHLPKTVKKDVLQNMIILFRDELSEWAKAYDDLLLSDSTDRATCDPLKTRAMWTSLADQGRDLYRLLFDLDDQTELNLVQLSENLKSLDAGSIIELDALDAQLPWGLLYEGDLPPASDPNYLEKLISQFWGIRYQLTVHPPWGNSAFNLKPYLSNTDGTRLTIAINQKTDEEYQTGQMSFFTGMKEKFSGRASAGVLALGTCKEHVIDNLRKREEPQHLFYFYCHHEKGDGEISLSGVPNLLQQTQILMEGDEQGVITLKELAKNSEIQPFKFRPVIFLNACQSGKLKMGDPTSFMTYFIRRLGSWNFVGTEAEIPAAFADEFGQAFVKRFLTGERIGKILIDLRSEYAQKHLNPFGLYYTLFGRSEICLQHPVPGIA